MAGPADDPPPIAFIGGGHMARALIGGLLRGTPPAPGILVVEPAAAAREALLRDFGIDAQPVADARLARAATVVWAVKPQQFGPAAAACAPYVGAALQVSVMAGVRSGTVAHAVLRDPGPARVVRAMPNTPALIGRGIAGLYATPGVGPAERAAVEALFAPTGATLWVEQEVELDAVTAVSGSGPAYVYYVLEAMMQAAAEMGLGPSQARQLVLATFEGATALAAATTDPPPLLRAQVTSPGGTTQAAIAVLEAHGVKAAFVAALRAAQHRARELGDAAA